jgi:hypothetical protein
MTPSVLNSAWHWIPLAMPRFVALAALCWIGAGDRVVRADEAASSEPPISDTEREHWSFRPLSQPEVPQVKSTTWVQNPIDSFVLARLEKEGLSPAPAVDRVTLIRRVTLDLTGLTPTPGQVDAFVTDQQPDAYERVVDRLLSSPAYGERWAQHWLDLARFAETDGFEHDLVRTSAWKYRDWAIKALNDDIPYDEFVRLQIAGDLLKPGDEDAAIATGFVLAGPDMPDINLLEERRHMVLSEVAATVGSVLLGLQVGCAECHDHKFDPISQADFYRLRSFFVTGIPLGNGTQHRVLRETDKPVESSLAMRGDFRRPGPRVEPAYLRIANLSGEQPATPPRAALAGWLTRADHPLATRVIVNRLWQHHFGKGLSETPSDFGIMGSAPTHPELLDWLAGELPRRGWSLKQMHKLMLTSATYRQASRLTETGDASVDATNRQAWAAAEEKDPENHLLWCARRQRLSGEAIRDCMLAASERLSTRTGGPGVRPPLPDELVKTLLKDQWQVSPDEEDHRRRSVYLFARRNLRYPLFEVFDRPDPSASCPRRGQSTTATQALTLLNSEFSLACARDLASYISSRGSDTAARVDLAYRRTLGRQTTSEELVRAQQFIAERAQQPRVGDTTAAGSVSVEETALTQFCLALFNLNEFVYVD